MSIKVNKNFEIFEKIWFRYFSVFCGFWTISYIFRFFGNFENIQNFCCYFSNSIFAKTGLCLIRAVPDLVSARRSLSISMHAGLDLCLSRYVSRGVCQNRSLPHPVSVCRTLISASPAFCMTSCLTGSPFKNRIRQRPSLTGIRWSNF